MKCGRCNNSDETFFYQGTIGVYCRKCIKFKRQLLMEEIIGEPHGAISGGASQYELNFELTAEQKHISKLCAQYIVNQDVLLHCVCGAGKTEIVIESISNALKLKKKVGFAISRRQVVLEIAERFKTIFYQAHVIAVCQGYTDDIDGDLIVCTTHQLYRYPNTFDLLVLDEPDAFPYKGDEVLIGIALNSAKGNMIYSTATLDDYLKGRINASNIKYLTLNVRPHGYDLPIPKIVLGLKWYLLVYLYWFIKNHQENIIVFVPTIKMATKLYYLFKYLCNCFYLSSKSDDKDTIIKAFRDKKYQLIFATTVLERGITIKGVLVVVLFPEHYVFDEASLIQMLGRVGRSFDEPTGECLLLSNRKSVIIKGAVEALKRANHEKMQIM